MVLDQAFDLMKNSMWPPPWQILMNQDFPTVKSCYLIGDVQWTGTKMLRF
jgi:hypothetical protein